MQRGGVQFERTAAATKDRPAQTMQGTAGEARFAGTTQLLTLSGNVAVAEPGNALRAERLVIARDSGDAEATGSVQVTYRQQAGAGAASTGGQGGPEPVHVVARRALLRRSAGVATFFGSPDAKARLWQGESQVEAPMLVFSQKDGVLDASGDPDALEAAEASGTPAGETARAVATVLADKSDAMAGGVARKSRAGVMRIASGRLHYSNVTRQAEFGGGVLLEDANGSMSCARAVATLRAQPSAPNPGATPLDKGPKPSDKGAVPSFGGGVERVVASGDVVIRQPGRTATGEQAVYMASDGLVTLTGTAGRPPRVVDETNGTLTGGSLRFHAGDNSVVVDGRSQDGKSSSGDGRVHTRTRVKQGR